MRNIIVAAVLLSTVALADDFTISITDPGQLAGIAEARTKYNAALPKDEKGAIVGEIKSDAEYFQHIAASWFASYASQKVAGDIATAVSEARQGDTKKLEDIAAALKANPVDPKIVPVAEPAKP